MTSVLMTGGKQRFDTNRKRDSMTLESKTGAMQQVRGGR